VFSLGSKPHNTGGVVKVGWKAITAANESKGGTRQKIRNPRKNQKMVGSSPETPDVTTLGGTTKKKKKKRKTN